jgi:uncharacterized membrane protein (DUF373 family)
MSENDGQVDLDRLIEPSETVIRVVEVTAAYLLVGLFAIGVLDLLISIFDLARTGVIFDPDEGIDAILTVIDKALLLFIIVELYQTVVAYSREESVTRIVIVAGLIAVSRKVISFRPDEFESTEALLINAVAFSLLLLVLVVAYYLVVRTERSESASGPETGSSSSSSSTSGTE